MRWARLVAGGLLAAWAGTPARGQVVAPPAVPVEVPAPCQGGHFGHRPWWRAHYRVPMAPPLGARVYAANRTQVAQGTLARMILRDYDFLEGTTTLNELGRGRLARIVAQRSLEAGPIFVEATPRHPGLDEARRAAIAEALAAAAPAIPAEQLVIVRDAAIGLDGAEALAIDRAQLYRVMAEGPPVGASTDAGGIVGGGSGGGAGAGFGGSSGLGGMNLFGR